MLCRSGLRVGLRIESETLMSFDFDTRELLPVRPKTELDILT
jgi:hypothetical protein